MEIFLVPDPNNLKHYYEIELGPYGHFLDMELNAAAKKKRDLGWSSGARIATARDATSRRVTIEVAFSAPALVAAVSRAAASGESLPFGLYRMEGKGPRQYLAWSPPRTPKPKFSRPRGLWPPLRPAVTRSVQKRDRHVFTMDFGGRVQESEALPAYDRSGPVEVGRGHDELADQALMVALLGGSARGTRRIAGA